jgi:hypothetical protein
LPQRFPPKRRVAVEVEDLELPALGHRPAR